MNIYVAGLGPEVASESLEALFSVYGQVNSSKVMIDGFTGYSRGFGFVEMPDSTEAANAISAIDGSMIQGLAVSVTEAKPAIERKGSYPVGSKYRK